MAMITTRRVKGIRRPIPWEDFAETWAHYLHIIDTLEMAGAFGVDILPRIDREHDLHARVDFNPYRPVPIEQVIDAWIPLSNALNSKTERWVWRICIRLSSRPTSSSSSATFTTLFMRTGGPHRHRGGRWCGSLSRALARLSLRA
jgi:hypothetical protein